MSSNAAPISHVTTQALQASASAFCAGEVESGEVWRVLSEQENTYLIDVRTPQEWAAGEPDLTALGRQAVKISWKLAPGYTLNSEFPAQLAQAVPDKNALLLFLCRSGGRSLDAAAAMTQQGYAHCYNITGGFEGAPVNNNQNGHHTGWKAVNLPWRQS